MSKLTRYWFEFDKSPSEIDGVYIGRIIWAAGVTAFDIEDAKILLKEQVFAEQEMPTTYDVVVDVDVSKLDPLHVLPNIYKAPSNRGVWFPYVT